MWVGLVLVALLLSCNDDPPEIFTIDQEKQLASALDSWVQSDSLLEALSRETYVTAYAYADTVFRDLLGFGQPDSSLVLDSRDLFDWRLTLVTSDEVNAFITPGGGVYVSTAMISLLQSPDEFAFLLAHMIAHGDQRYPTKELLNYFKVKDLEKAARENEPLLGEVAGYLFGRQVAFSFSLADERTADALATEILAPSYYNCDGGVLFYTLLDKQKAQGSLPEYYQAHEIADDRVTTIAGMVASMGCNTNKGTAPGITYNDFKNSLPR